VAFIKAFFQNKLASKTILF